MSANVNYAEIAKKNVDRTPDREQPTDDHNKRRANRRHTPVVKQVTDDTGIRTYTEFISDGKNWKESFYKS